MLKFLYILIQDKKLKNDCLKYFLAQQWDNIKVYTDLSNFTQNVNDSLVLTDSDSVLESPEIQQVQNNTVSEFAYLGIGENYSGSSRYVLENFDEVETDYFDMIYRRYHHLPVTVFETADMIVREISTDDLPELYNLYETITEFVEPLYEYERELEFTRNYIEHMYGFYGYGLWLVYLKENGRLIGRMGLEHREIDGMTEVELGYLLAPDYRNKGYAYRCCHKILDYAFHKLYLERVFLCVNKNNDASIGLGRKLGFKMYAEDIEGMNLYRIMAEEFISD